MVGYTMWRCGYRQLIILNIVFVCLGFLSCSSTRQTKKIERNTVFSLNSASKNINLQPSESMLDSSHNNALAKGLGATILPEYKIVEDSDISWTEGARPGLSTSETNASQKDGEAKSVKEEMHKRFQKRVPQNLIAIKETTGFESSQNEKAEVIETLDTSEPQATPRTDEFMEALKKEIEKRFQERLREKKMEIEDTSDESIDQKAGTDDVTTIKPPEHQEAPQTEEDREAMKQAELFLQNEITGLVINQTVSPFGSHFYKEFYIDWEAPQVSEQYNIYIIERTLASFGFNVYVKVDDYLVWAKRLTPRFQEIDKAVDEAQQQVKLFLENYEEIQKQLAGNDMAGNGL